MELNLKQDDAGKDHELIRSFLGGESWAFEELMERYQERAYRLAYGLTGDSDRAQDLTQEAFIRAFGGLKDFQFRSSFGTWLHRIIVNLYLSQLRKERLRRALSLAQIIQRPAGSREQPDRQLAARDLAARLDGAVAALPPKQRAVFLLRYDEKLPYAEIAAIMQRSEGAVRANYHQAILKLRQSLGELADETDEA